MQREDPQYSFLRSLPRCSGRKYSPSPPDVELKVFRVSGLPILGVILWIARRQKLLVFLFGAAAAALEQFTPVFASSCIASLATLPAAEIAAIAPIHFAPDLFSFFHPAAVEPAGTFA